MKKELGTGPRVGRGRGCSTICVDVMKIEKSRDGERGTSRKDSIPAKRVLDLNKRVHKRGGICYLGGRCGRYLVRRK